MKLLTRDEFLGLTDREQANYLNDLAVFLGTDKPTYEKDDQIYDRDSHTVIEDLFDSKAAILLQNARQMLVPSSLDNFAFSKRPLL